MIDQPSSLRELKNRVRCYVAKLQEVTDDPRPSIMAELAKVNGTISGWTLSLSNSNLPSTVRYHIELEMETGIELKRQLEQSLIDLDHLSQKEAFDISDTDVLQRLDRLGEVLDNSNPTLAHLELSLHIDRIDCFGDGSVVARFCNLGLAGQDAIEAVSIIDGQDDVIGEPTGDTDDKMVASKCKPRRRARLHAQSDSYDASELETLSFWATDPNRFADLSEDWFESVRFELPEPTYWSKENAISVSEKRMEGLTHQQLADHFGVTMPTIRKALKFGLELDPRFAEAPRKMPRARWHEDHADEVLQASKRMLIKEMVDHFGKSDVTLRKAVKYAKEKLGRN